MKYVYKNELDEILGVGNCHMFIDGAVEYEATKEDISKYESTEEITNLRIRREEECFSIYNRNYPKGYFTEEQQKELDNWYLAWLDVPNKYMLGMNIETIIPAKPNWLK